MKVTEENINHFEGQKASGALPTDFLTSDEKEESHHVMM